MGISIFFISVGKNICGGEKMNTKERILDFLDKQGFYIVLALCLVVISVTAILTLTGEKKARERAQNITFEEVGQEANYGGENEELADVTTQVPQATADTKATLTLSRPVSGDVLMEFSKDKLLYNSTLKQWTTHSGIDISAKEGDVVKAALGGTVENVYEDALMGKVIVISHDNGYKTVYSNLDKTVSVAVGDKVTKDQDIGKVGKTAICEFDMEPHLHFELMSGEERLNPMEYMTGLKLKKNEQK